MNKTIAILIFTFFLGCNALAQAPQSVPPTDTVAPVVAITQQQLDSLVSAAARGNQMELIAKQEAERMFDSYTTHVSWVVGLLGVLITILVAVSGFFVPYMTNKRFQEEMDEKIAAHDNEIEQSRQSLYEQIRKNEQLMSELEGVKNHVDQVEASIKEMQEKMKQSEEQARQSAITAKASALFSKALKEKDTDIKISLYTEVLDLDPQSVEAHNNRGNAYSDKGEYDKAIQDYAEAIKLNPQYAEAYYNRGNVYCNKGEYDKAIQDYAEAIKLNPQYAEAYYNRGTAYLKKGEYDKAIQDYGEAIKLSPQDAIAYNNRGATYFNKGEYDKAIQDYDEAIKFNPQYAEAFNNRGVVHSEKGEYDKAIQDYAEAIKLNPQYALTYNNRGNCYMRRGKEGDYVLAKADFEKGLTLNSDEELRQKLQENLRDVEDKMNGNTDSAPTQ